MLGGRPMALLIFVAKQEVDRSSNVVAFNMYWSLV